MRILTVEMLLVAGSFFAFVAALGLLRFPDLFMRLSATAKAGTVGTGFILGAAAVHFDDPAVTGKIAAIIAFTVLTAPVAAHMIGRAAYYSKIPLWEGTICDELGEGAKKSADKRGETSGEGE
ncbi:monovalent cation/H(+) antiporter subunit G [Geobacter sp. DSM 9736]|uniref:monovalent cation/H(+) antiporter subunit G n=1 Tax=Geobacter sp. DSM 9736 TaxID=1277350 RepID=UPI000B615561|nr:monovalent cation/H(+) antiporter subunit G [Geobacter sp. DSM 9736]SNB46894.1 multisubunit sodium/proton antiporter, MrpG subunit [Geobacter sp. DSM 9736]